MRYLFTLSAIFLLHTLFSSAFAIELSIQERAWLRNNPVVIVGAEKDWAPFDFVDLEGQYNGIAKDYLDIIEKETGLRFEYVIDDWNQLLTDFKSGKIDLLPAIYYSDERAEFSSFTKSYSQHADFLFTKKSSKPYTSLNELKGRKLAVIKGYDMEDYVRLNYPEISLVAEPTVLQAIQAVITGKADALLNDLASTSYIANKYSIIGIEPVSMIEERVNYLHMASQRSQPELAAIINKVLEFLDEETHLNIRRKWINWGLATDSRPVINLNQEEKEWLKNNPIINCTSDPDWMPFEGKDENNNFVGLFSDILNLVADRAGITIRYIPSDSWSQVLQRGKNKEIDCFAAMPTTDRKEYMRFTDSFLTRELVLVTHQSHSIIHDLSTYNGDKIALIEGYGYNKEILEKYPMHEYVYVDSVSDGLDRLSDGSIDVFVTNITSTLYYMGKKMLNQLKIAGRLDIDVEIGIAVRDDWPVLHQILNKALSTISENEKDELMSKWVKVEYIQKLDYTLLLRHMAGVLLVLIILSYWLKKLYSMNQRYIKQNAVIDAVQNLQARFIDHTSPTYLYERLLEDLVKLTDSQFGLLGEVQSNADGSHYLKIYALSDISWDKESSAQYEVARSIGLEFRNLNNLLGQAVINRTLVINNNAASRDICQDLPKHHPEIDSFMGIPVLFGEKIVGQIALANRDKGYNLQVKKYIEPLVSAYGQIVVARWEQIARTNAEKKLAKLARLDGLLGIPNRRSLDEYLKKQWTLCSRNRQPLSLIMVDIDHFKLFNDHYGHQAGDECLKEVSNTIASSFDRPSDYLARYGGEEFVCILPDTPINGVRVVAEKISKAMKSASIPHAISPTADRVTVSMGTATVVPSPSILPQGLIEAADKCLYKSKSDGRNKITSKLLDGGFG